MTVIGQFWNLVHIEPHLLPLYVLLCIWMTWFELLTCERLINLGMGNIFKSVPRSPCIMHVNEELRQEGWLTWFSYFSHFPVSFGLCSLRWGSPENPMKSAYLILIAQGYANFYKTLSAWSWIAILYLFLEICIYTHVQRPYWTNTKRLS